MFRRLVFLVALVALVALAALAGCAAPTAVPAAPTAAPKAKLRVAFVYVAPVGDLGWTWAHDQARQKVQAEFGDRIETSYIENVPEGPEAERVIRDFANKGFGLIITTSFGFMDPTVNVAKEFPKVWFVHVSGYKTAPNLSTIFGKIEEPRYVSGLIAGKMTKVKKLGYVAAFPIPEVVRGINSFTLGVRKSCPDCTVTVVWTSTWFDPVKEKEAAVALLDQGADVIAQHQDTTEPQKAAAEAGKLSVGYDSDMGKFVGASVLTSPVWNWSVKYSDIIRQVLDGTYKTESWWGGWKDGVVDLAPLSDKVPADARALAEAETAKFKAGTDSIFTVFAGPLKDNAGAEKVPAGKQMTADELLNMDWFIEGVVGKVK